MNFQTFLQSCGLGSTDFQQKFSSAGFTKVSELVELVGDWDAKPEKKQLYNTLCGTMLELSAMQNLKLLTALKKEHASASGPGAAVDTHIEAEDQKEATPGAGEAETETGCIDLAFVLDTTGSMGSYIHSAQKNIRDIVQKVTADKEVTDVRFALVSYKDYNQGDTTKLVSRHQRDGTVTQDDAPDETETPGPEGTTSTPGLLDRLSTFFGGSSTTAPPPAKKNRKMKKSRRSAPRRAYGGGNGFDDGTAARIYDFTANVGEMQQFVDMQVASGGGDGPEAVATALDCCENLSWRENAAKIAILIADAPPHGIEASGDHFPNGDPIDRDALTIARALADKDISIYTVACEPSVTNSFKFCRDFMEGVAEIGGGMLVPLSSAKLLTDMVLASCKEGADLEKIQGEVEQELKQLKKANPNADQDRLAQMCSRNLAARGVSSHQVSESSNAYGAFDKRNVRLFAGKGATLRGTKASLAPTAAPKNWDRGFASQAISSEKAMFSASQCSRMMKKKSRKWGY